MSNTCFYCDVTLEGNALHQINFFHENKEHEETLCPDCYEEWLQGIKE